MLSQLHHVQPPKDAFYHCISCIFLTELEQAVLSMSVEDFFHCSPLSCLACVIGQSSEKRGGGIFLTFESDILFSLGRSQCSIFVSKIHIGNAKSSHAGVRRGRCQDPVALFRNWRVIQQNQATYSKDQVHPVISLDLKICMLSSLSVIWSGFYLPIHGQRSFCGC